MIDAKKLMIGNLLGDSDLRLCEVDRVGKSVGETSIFAVKGSITSLPFRPLLLTPNILRLLSIRSQVYEQRGNGQDHQPQDYISYEGVDHYITDRVFIRDSVYRWKNRNGEILRDQEPLKVYIDHKEVDVIDIKYLHQFQNWYYWTFNEELDVSEVVNQFKSSKTTTRLTPDILADAKTFKYTS